MGLGEIVGGIARRHREILQREQAAAREAALKKQEEEALQRSKAEELGQQVSGYSVSISTLSGLSAELESRVGSTTEALSVNRTKLIDIDFRSSEEFAKIQTDLKALQEKHQADQSSLGFHLEALASELDILSSDSGSLKKTQEKVKKQEKKIKKKIKSQNSLCQEQQATVQRLNAEMGSLRTEVFSLQRQLNDLAMFFSQQ